LGSTPQAQANALPGCAGGAGTTLSTHLLILKALDLNISLKYVITHLNPHEFS
jgi:hypothetical protein